MDIILLIGFSYAIYRMAVDYNITPWKWIIRYIAVFVASMIALILTLVGIYGLNTFKDITAMQKIMLPLAPFVWLYQFMLFYFFRTRILRYIHILDQIDNNNNNDGPSTPSPKKDQKDQKDFSYFR